MSWRPALRSVRPVQAFLLTLVAVIIGTVGYQVLTWPDVARLRIEPPASTAFIEQYRAERRAAGKPEATEWRWVPDVEISPALHLAVLSGEDVGFFGHHGFAVGEMRAAITDALRGRRALRGASTITQQLAKNLWLSPSRNPLRKVKEAILTWQLERKLSKSRILALYLNVVEFGPGIYGAEAAAGRYFGKPATALDEHESALLAASLPRPSTWHPGSDSPSYATHVARIESRMQRVSFLRSRLGVVTQPQDTVVPFPSDSALAELMRSDSTFLPGEDLR